MRRIERFILVAAMSATLLSGLVLPLVHMPKVAAASGITPYVWSAFGDSSQHFDMAQYKAIRGTPSNPNVTWPINNTGQTCNTEGTPYKALPWEGFNPDKPAVGSTGVHHDNGDYMDDSGACISDSIGQASTWGGWSNGAWLDKSYAGWALPGGSLPNPDPQGAQTGYSGKTSQFSPTECSPNGGTDRYQLIWSYPAGADIHNQNADEYQSLFPGPDYLDYTLYTHGTILTRKDFTINAADLPAVQAAGGLKMYVVADDWARVYVNGQLFNTGSGKDANGNPATVKIDDFTSQSALITIPYNVFKNFGTPDASGNIHNTIAIQAADKIKMYRHDPSNHANDRGMGLCYVLYRNSGGSSSGSPTANCSISFVPTDARVEKSQPFTAKVNLTISGGNPSQSYSYTEKVSAAGTTFSPNSYSGAGPPGSYTNDFPGTAPSALSPSVTLTANISGSVNTSCSTSFAVVAKPYFKVNDGDISAGTTNCSSSAWPISDGKLVGWNQGTGSYTGAGTNLAVYLAAQAAATIDGVASAQPTSGSSPPKDLSFANASGTYGNSLSQLSCPQDYYTGHVTGGGLVSTIPNTMADYQGNGPFTLNGTAAGGIRNGNRVAMYVIGDVRIKGNIILANGAGVRGLSNFYLVVKGNIYIDASVNQLDGVYIAQDDGSGNKGRIYTCDDPNTNSGFSHPTGGQVAGTSPPSCQTPLLVNGAFIASQLKLYRSAGSLSTGPAEIFNYTLSVWLAPPASIVGGGNSGYDAITSLPPVL